MGFFPLNTLNIPLSCLHSFWRVVVILIFAPLIGQVCFILLASSRIFSLIFYSLKIICLGIVFWHLPYFVFSDLPGSVVWCLTLIWGKVTVIIASNISSVPFFGIAILTTVILLWLSIFPCSLLNSINLCNMMKGQFRSSVFPLSFHRPL